MKPIKVMAAATLLALSGLVLAHGDEDHHNSAGGGGKGHAAALGAPGVAKNVTRTVEITMSDAMRYSPANVAARKGDTIRFVLKNEGKIKHEMVLGTIAELKEHAALMQKFPEMEHADPNQASVEPGKTGELIWHFTKTGRFDFACLQPGHYEAGMRGEVVVAGGTSKAKAGGSATPTP